MAGWSIGSIARLEYRDRCLVAIAGVAPDIDGIGIVPELVVKNLNVHLNWWSEYHHVPGHNITFGFLLAIVCGLTAYRKIATALMAFFSFHVHLIGDVLGARGPDGYQWPVSYFYPFNNEIKLIWDGQWALNAWPNFVVTGILVYIALYMGWKRGITPLELASKRANNLLVQTLRHRYGDPTAKTD